MNAEWLAAFGLLTLLVFVMATVLIGLVRRVTTLLDRVERTLLSSYSSAELMPNGLAVGDMAPLSIETRSVQVAEGLTTAEHRASLILFLEAGCEACKVLYKDIVHRRFDPSPLAGVAVIDHPDEFDNAVPNGWTVMGDPSREISAAWLVNSTPICFLLDDNGVIRGMRGEENEIMNSETSDTATSRRRFLRNVAALFGTGAGVLLLQSEPASGALPPSVKYQCCRDETCEHCPGGPVRYRCRPTGDCGGSVFCTCASPDLAPCYNILCP